jgi:F0F1-type ATP synthase beta subunit
MVRDQSEEGIPPGVGERIRQHGEDLWRETMESNLARIRALLLDRNYTSALEAIESLREIVQYAEDEERLGEEERRLANSSSSF